jgi:Tol biopolymer transport system component
MLPGVLRVRAVDSPLSAHADPGVPLLLEGVDTARIASRESCIIGCKKDPAIYVQHLYPFQDAYGSHGAMLFRPSWSPDGSRVVFSDGLRLLLWNPSQSVATPIANTADGVSAAWSPNGNTIAFTRLLRTDSVRTQCACREPEFTLTDSVNDTFFGDRHIRWTYVTAPPVVVLVNADGTDAQPLTEGEDPAWSPDGSTLYFRKGDQLYRIARSGGAPVAIAQTAGARSPAVSPDGNWLAFTKGTPANQNVWILKLTGQ